MTNPLKLNKHKTAKIATIMFLMIFLAITGSSLYNISIAKAQNQGSGEITLSPSDIAMVQGENWQKQGIIYTAKDSDGYIVAEPNVLYEDGVFRLWFRGWGGYINYAESTDGTIWTSPHDIHLYNIRDISPFCQPFVMKYGSVYYMYATDQEDAAIGAPFSLLTSSDGINWTRIASHLLDSTATDYIFGNLCVWVEGSQWYMMYESMPNGYPYHWQISLATSSDGVSWTRYSGNPVLANPGLTGMTGGPDVFKINGVYYMWYHAANKPEIEYDTSSNLPTDINLAISTNLINWTLNGNNPVLARTTIQEGLGSPWGQVADPCITFTPDKGIWMFYGGGFDQSPDASKPLYIFAAKLVSPPTTPTPTATPEFNSPLPSASFPSPAPTDTASPSAATVTNLPEKLSQSVNFPPYLTALATIVIIVTTLTVYAHFIKTKHKK